MDPTLSSLIVRAKVGTQTLAVSNYVKSLSLLQIQAPSAELVSGSDLNGNGGIRISRRRGRIDPLTVNLDLAGFGVLLIHQQMVELVCISLTAVSLEYAHSNAAQTINVSLSTLRILSRLGFLMLCALQFSTKPLYRIETGLAEVFWRHQPPRRHLRMTVRGVDVLVEKFPDTWVYAPAPLQDCKL
ncbi:hypothetical protein BS47DRAFT_1101696 [Hydnum rufescens UP504]|uniref:Uncharacterized protein n=1 Tax=Hydnum rufescens UP504 TaxID=1448309 RepID=A0A9P6AUK3_9AGAM|nr:hypothetical protein BS47DRAFT_1101696 [Hydnum rufescens UP504]